MNRRRIGEIIRRHIHRLNRGDGTGIRVGDALLQPRQLCAHRRLIAQPRRHLAHQAGYLHSGLDEAEDVVHEQQHVAVLVVAEILGHRQRGVTHAEPAAGRLVHLAEDHHHVGQHAGFLHVAVKLLAFATTFADAAEDADTLLVPDHVVDHLGEQHGLAHARPAEKSRLAAAFQRHEHINDLDARFEDLRLGGTPRQRRRRAMDGTPLHVAQRRTAIDGVAKHIEHSRENPFADRRLQRPARVLDRHAAGETLRGRQGNPPHVPRIALRQHFDDDLLLRSRSQHRVDRRQMPIEADIHNAAAHRDHGAGIRAPPADFGRSSWKFSFGNAHWIHQLINQARPVPRIPADPPRHGDVSA
jgi:hypothetical protein